MIYTAIYNQHFLNVYATVELLFFREASSWVVWASLTLLLLITVVACCFIVMNYYQKVSLKLNRGSFFFRINHISNSHLLLHCTCWQWHSLVVQCRCCKIPKQQDLLIPLCLDIKWTMVTGMSHRLYLSAR